MNSRRSKDNLRGKKVVRGGLVGALLIGIAAIFATAGVRNRQAASADSPTIPTDRTAAFSNLQRLGIARADADTLDLQLG